MKKYVAVLGSAMFFVICVSLYLMLETINEPRGIDSALDKVCYLFVFCSHVYFTFYAILVLM